MKSPASPPRNGPVSRPAPDDEPSPVPGPTAHTVRPPKGPAPAKAEAPKPKSRVLSALQLLAGLVVVVACSGAAAWGARHYMTTSPRFAVRTVLVSGNARRTAPEIAERAGIAVGENVFSLDLDQATAAILSDPWIARATATRKLPGTINVAVVEHEVHALVAIGGELYLATADGELFKKFSDGDPVDLPIVTGLAPELVVKDRPGVAIAVREALEVVTELERAGIAKRYPIQEVHLEKDGTLAVVIGKAAITIQLGSAPFRGKIEQARRVLAEIAARKADASMIFLDNDAHPERVVVRMR